MTYSYWHTIYGIFFYIFEKRQKIFNFHLAKTKTEKKQKSSKTETRLFVVPKLNARNLFESYRKEDRVSKKVRLKKVGPDFN